MANRSILIVEDDAHLRTILARALERGGHSVRATGTLAQARAALAATTPEVLLLDIDLPDGAGWELLDDQAPPGAGAVVVMSAGQPSRRRMQQYQSACFLGKPFAIDTLLEVVERMGASEHEGLGAADALAGAERS
jgi:two-component system nitrogen regulation response regulator GlnG